MKLLMQHTLYLNLKKTKFNQDGLDTPLQETVLAAFAHLYPG
jgi:hypothetical protein